VVATFRVHPQVAGYIIPPGPDPAFAAHVKSVLETTTDAELVGFAGECLTPSTRLRYPLDWPDREMYEEAERESARRTAAYAELLLQRAQSLDPGNARWSKALAQLERRADAPAVEFAIPPPEAPDLPA
jgi:hypothetical protein